MWFVGAVRKLDAGIIRNRRLNFAGGDFAFLTD
jgi:hypothetical protein